MIEAEVKGTKDAVFQTSIEPSLGDSSMKTKFFEFTLEKFCITPPVPVKDSQQ